MQEKKYVTQIHNLREVSKGIISQIQNLRENKTCIFCSITTLRQSECFFLCNWKLLYSLPNQFLLPLILRVVTKCIPSPQTTNIAQHQESWNMRSEGSVPYDDLILEKLGSAAWWPGGPGGLSFILWSAFSIICVLNAPISLGPPPRVRDARAHRHAAAVGWIEPQLKPYMVPELRLWS